MARFEHFTLCLPVSVRGRHGESVFRLFPAHRAPQSGKRDSRGSLYARFHNAQRPTNVERSTHVPYVASERGALPLVLPQRHRFPSSSTLLQAGGTSRQIQRRSRGGVPHVNQRLAGRIRSRILPRQPPHRPSTRLARLAICTALACPRPSARTLLSPAATLSRRQSHPAIAGWWSSRR